MIWIKIYYWNETIATKNDTIFKYVNAKIPQFLTYISHLCNVCRLWEAFNLEKKILFKWKPKEHQKKSSVEGPDLRHRQFSILILHWPTRSLGETDKEGNSIILPVFPIS